MRISIITAFLIITSLQVLLAFAARGQDIGSETVKLELKQESLESAIKKIEQQTSLRFYYRRSDIKNLTNISLINGTRSIQQTLQQLLQNSFINFSQIGNNILLQKNLQQTGYQVKGRVVDQNHTGIGFANITITKKINPQIVQLAKADTGGNFSIPVTEKGDYLAKISAAGMDSLSIAFSLTDSKVVELPEIQLLNSVKQLKQVNIISTKPYLEQKIDRVVVNVDALISNNGANALEVLKNSPGVIVDQNGNIQLKGKGVIVLIDDKPTYISGENLAGYLRSLPASALSQVELMSNPPAKYDAAGNGGIINIKTKKLKRPGFNGTVNASYGQGILGRTNESVNLNYNTGKLNIFTTVSFNDLNYRRKNLESRDYFNNNQQLLNSYTETDNYNTHSQTPLLKFGMDYKVSEKTTVGLVVNGSLSRRHYDNPGTSLFSNNKGMADSSIIANNTSTKRFNNGGINFNLNHQFDSLGKDLSADLDYVKYHSRANQTFINNSYLPNGTFIDNQTITASLPTDINIYSAKSDFTLPLKGKAKFETGVKSSYVNTDNTADYFNLINGINTIDYNNTNQFIYKENVNAAYINFNKDFKRFSLQAGLRIENTNVTGHQLGNVLKPDSSFAQHYTNLFPTAYLSYKLDTAGNSTLNLSAGRRIGRPFYQDLNPFTTITNKFSYNEGNPFLKPEFSTNYDLVYSYKSVFSATLLYSRTTNSQNQITRQSGDILISSIGNIGVVKIYGILTSLTLTPVKWWTSYFNVQLFNGKYTGQIYNSYLNQAKVTYFAMVTNQFNLSRGWTAELTPSYLSGIQNGQYIIAHLGGLDAGIQKKILNNKGSIKLSAADLLNSRKPKAMVTNIPNLTNRFQNFQDNRVFTIGFSYNFGSNKNNSHNTNKSSVSNEKSRVKN